MPVLDWPDLERLRTLAARAEHAVISEDEKREVRSIVTRHVPQANELSWEDVLDVAFFWLGIYSIAKMGQRAAAASAS